MVSVEKVGVDSSKNRLWNGSIPSQQCEGHQTVEIYAILPLDLVGQLNRATATDQGGVPSEDKCSGRMPKLGEKLGNSANEARRREHGVAELVTEDSCSLQPGSVLTSTPAPTGDELPAGNERPAKSPERGQANAADESDGGNRADSGQRRAFFSARAFS